MARKPITSNKPIRESVQAEPKKRELDLDLELLLSSEEREAIRRKAALKIEARDKEEAADRYLKQEMARLDLELHPEIEEEKVSFTPDLAIFADAIRLDGQVMHHGYTYMVRKSALAQLLDIQFQTHRHHSEINRGGDSDNFYRRSREMSINMDSGSATAGGRPVRF
jgi:hypothetical protein